MRVQSPRRIAGATAIALVMVAIGCALGPEQEPGCQRDADCGEGFVCSAGACFRTTTERSLPSTDAGDDAGGDAG